jgi:cell wall-associated NlpC family hydrolase
MTWTPKPYSSEAEARAAVVAEALTWELTPWHHRGRIKRVGVDCGQFPLLVYAAAGLIETFDTGEYARDHMLHSAEERMLAMVQRFAVEIDQSAIGPGDVVLYKFGRVFSHAALVLDWPQIIHPLVGAGCVVRGDADRDHYLIDKPARFFSYWAHDGG